jgi:hypothetical protein
MKIDPRISFVLNLLFLILSGIALGTVKFTGLLPDHVANLVTGWAAFSVFVLSCVNMALHGYSSGNSGPWVAPNGSVIPAAPTSNVTKLPLFLIAGAALGLVFSMMQPASAAPVVLHQHKIVKRAKRAVSAPHVRFVPQRQKLSLNLNLLLTQLQAVSLTDLQTAKADADAQKDTVASQCYAQIITLVSNQQKTIAAQANLPDVHVVTTFQQARDFALALRQGSPLSTACAPLANEVKMDVLNLVAGVTAGSLSLSSFGL